MTDRRRGARIGLAGGDAPGAAVEFQEPGSFAPVNLGDDADTTGAICGQLAGAFWGGSNVPDSPRSGLARTDMPESALAGIVGD